MFSRKYNLHSCDSDCLPFAPRQRGEGDAAAPDEGPLFTIAPRQRTTHTSNLGKTHACPFAPRSGEKVVRQHRMRGRGRWGAIVVAAVRERHFVGVAVEARKRPSSAAAAAPSPRRHGEKGQAGGFTRVQLAFLRQHPPSHPQLPPHKHAHRSEATPCHVRPPSSMPVPDSPPHPLLERKNARRRSALSGARRPDSTVMRWLWRSETRMSKTLPAAPVFGSWAA